MPGQPLLESLLAVDANWYGSPAFAYKGAPPKLPAHLRAEAVHQLHAVDSALAQGTTEREVAELLYTLQGHYWQAGMSETLMLQVAGDYVRLLIGYPLEAFKRARDACLTDPERKFFPKVGEMKKLLDGQLAMMRWRKQQLETWLSGK